MPPCPRAGPAIGGSSPFLRGPNLLWTRIGRLLWRQLLVFDWFEGGKLPTDTIFPGGSVDQVRAVYLSSMHHLVAAVRTSSDSGTRGGVQQR